MLYSIIDREVLENLEELDALQNQVQEVRLKDKLGKQKYHYEAKKLQEPFIDTIKDTSESLTKALTETSEEKNLALEILNTKLLEIMKNRGIITSYLMSPLSKITNAENTSQFKFVKD